MAWLLPRLIRWVIALLSKTIRWHHVGEPYRKEHPGRHVFAFWHANLLMMGVALKGCRGYTLISKHRDGGFIAEALHLQGFRTIRGSSSRGGARALLQMVRLHRQENCDFGITPDGPKGPREVVKPGVIQLAKKTGLPVRPISYATSRYWRITSSWDHFYIPKPFSRGVIVYGESLTIAADACDEVALARVQQAMDATQHIAQTYFETRIAAVA